MSGVFVPLRLADGRDASPPGDDASRGIGVERGTMRLLTLGCKVNQYETEHVRELLAAAGYREAEPGERIDLAVVNTCTVTAAADRKGRRLIRRLARDNPGVRIVATGCYATRRPEEVGSLRGVAAVLPDKHRLAEGLAPFGVTGRVRGIRRFGPKTRAFVKAQDGCILNCSFCVIPSVRHGLASRPLEEIVEEVAGLIAIGHREIVLAGIHLGHYGVDFSKGRPKAEWRRLWHLLDRLARLPGDFRIRLSSLEATEVTDDFVRVLADHADRICPHLHLSMQSGSDRVLAAMKRRYPIGRFLDRCETIRSRLDDPAFTTDAIVGFPGETESDFRETLAACREARFSKIHVFPFSPRSGTEAATLPDRVDPATKADRGARLEALGSELAADYFRGLIGRRLQMLIENADADRPGWMRGTSCRYAPLRLKTLGELTGRLVAVRAVSVVDGAIDAEPIPEP